MRETSWGKIHTLGVFEDVPKKIQTQNHFQPRSSWLVSRGLRESAEAVLEFDKGGRGKGCDELFLLFSQTVSNLALDYTYCTSIFGVLVLAPIVVLRFFFWRRRSCQCDCVRVHFIILSLLLMPSMAWSQYKSMKRSLVFPVSK